MKLTRTTTYPTAAALRQASIGTIYEYRRDFPFSSEPMVLVVVKLADDRWVRAQSTTSREDALAAIAGQPVASFHTRVLDDVDSAKMARTVTRKEVEADGKEEHVGLFTGALPASTLPRRDEPDRIADETLSTIAAARKAAGTKAGATALAKELARHQPQQAATKKELEALADALGAVPPDLAQLLRWSNGHAELGLMAIPQLIDVFQSRDEPRLLPLNDNENGDYWCLVLGGPLAGALFYDDYALDDPPPDAIKATSLAAWLADPDA